MAVMQTNEQYRFDKLGNFSGHIGQEDKEYNSIISYYIIDFMYTFCYNKIFNTFYDCFATLAGTVPY